MADGEVLYEIRGDSSKLDNDLDEGNSKVKKSSERLGNIAKGTGIAIGAAFATTSVAAVNLANDMDNAVNGIIAATGESSDAAEKYQDVIEGIYKNNYGEGFDDIAESISAVKQQMDDISDEELQNVVEKGYLMQDTFGVGMEESVRGVNAMMKQFGISSEEAYELMAQGAQNGLNQNGDLADQLSEYSVYYANLGYSAEEMFNAVANGAADGTFQIDYLNDAMKEFGIRSKDGSDASADAFAALGLNAGEMTAAFAEGGEASKKAFDKVAKALKKTDDKVLQNQVGVALFGTKWEDLGVDAIEALTNTDGAIDETKDKLGEMEDVKYSSLGDMFEGLKRSVEMLLLPLGEQLIPILSEVIEAVMPILEEIMPPLMSFIEELLPPLMEIVQAILPPLVDLFIMLSESIMPILEVILPVLIDLLNTLLPPLIEILNAILPPLIEILNILLEPIMELIETLLPPLMELLDALAPLFDALMPIITGLAEILGAVLGKAFEAITPLIDGLIKILGGLIDFITGVFTGNWSKAWDGVKNIFGGIWDSMKGLFKIPVNWIIDGINKFTRGLNKIKIPDWVPGVGGKGFHIGKIPRLKVGMDYVPSDYFPAYLDAGEAVLTADEAQVYRSLGGKGSLQEIANGNINSGSNEQSGNSFTQIINAPKSPGPRETAKYTRQLFELHNTRG